MSYRPTQPGTRIEVHYCLLGKPISILLPPDRPDEVGEILQRLKRGERIDHFETVRVRKDGKNVRVSVTISPIKNASGAIVGASSIARQIDSDAGASRRTTSSRFEATS